MKKLLITILLSFLFVFGLSGTAWTGDMQIKYVSWNANLETDLAGYEIHYGRTGGNYTFMVIMDTRTMYPLVLEEGITYYFAAKAFDASGNRSSFSGELVYTVPVTPVGDTDPPATVTTINIPVGTSVIINIP